MMNAVFTNVGAFGAELEEGQLYRVGKGTIKATPEHNSWNNSHC
jgi:hypothetical protein